MIPYEELEKALARWKARRTPDAASAAEAEGEAPTNEWDIPSGVKENAAVAELDIGDAVLDEA